PVAGGGGLGLARRVRRGGRGCRREIDWPARTRQRGLAPLFFNPRKRNGRNQCSAGEGTPRTHRPWNDGVQEGADGGGRRPQESRGAAAHQERRQGEQGREPRRG